MALGNLGQLRTAALQMRTDMVGRFPEFLTLAEQRIYFGDGDVPPLRVLQMELSASLSLSNGVATLPAGFLEKRAIIWPALQNQSLIYEPPSVFYPNQYRRRSAATPEAYTIESTTVRVDPPATGSATLLYYGKAAAMVTDTDTNVILTNYPSVYLFGTQIELFRELRNDTEMQKAISFYSSAVRAANMNAMHARAIGGPMRKTIRGLGV